MKNRLKSIKLGIFKKNKGNAKSRWKKLRLNITIISRSKAKPGSLIITADIAAESTESNVNGITRRLNGRKSPHATPSSNPPTTPTLDIIDKRAKTNAQRDFGSVSIISMFNGVAAADETSEKIE